VTSQVRRLTIAGAVACALAGTLPAVAAAPGSAESSVTTGVVQLRTTDNAGTCAGTPRATRGPNRRACPTFKLYYAAPRSRPRGLVVVFHGHGHNGEQYPPQLAQIARQDNVVAVAARTPELSASAPNFRGPFQAVDDEARDAAAAIGWARSRYHTGTHTYLLGISMGGSGLAYFLDAATRKAAGDTDARWVQSFHPLPLAGLVDAEGIANLGETWLEASGFDKVSAAEIESETGGTPTTAPAAYQARSLALLPTSEWQATGLSAVAVIHDVDDGLVPYNQTFEARAAVAAAGIPLRTYDVVFKDYCSQGDQTTGSATLTGVVPAFPTGESESTLCLAGHANENDAETPIMEAAVTALHALVTGTSTPVPTLVNPRRPAS
jgi:hypothetical protein